MPDREKVIKTLTDALSAKENYPWAKAEMSFEFIEMLLELLKEREAVVRCKECKHRPKEPDWATFEDGGDIEFPENSKCPCQNTSDRYYSWYPDDDWFCADGERRTE